MATTDLSSYDPSLIPSASDMRFGVVVSDWNNDVTWSLLRGTVETLMRHGATEENIIVRHLPGSFELPLGAQFMVEYEEVDAVICLGCIIQGETPHFEYVCKGVTEGISRLNLDYNIPFIFGVLTTASHQQATERSGGKHGNKGDEAAITAIRMVALQRELSRKSS